MRQMTRPRSDGVMRAHGPDSKARRAARTAASTSSACPEAHSAITSPQDGSKTSNVA